MRYSKLYLLFFTGVSLLFCQGDKPELPEQEYHPFDVHVLLEKRDQSSEKHSSAKHDPVLWTFSCEAGFVVSDPLLPDRRDLLDTKQCVISFEQGILCVNKRKLHMKRIKVESQDPKKHELQVVITEKKKQHKRSYSGSFSVFWKDAWHLINSVDLEEYVSSVLASESWPNWPLELNKAFAIVMRSFVVYHLLQARGKKKVGKDFLFDVTCTNSHQTYRGTHEYAVLKQAVEETKGAVLSYQSKPILAMYDICCGGIIPAKMKHAGRLPPYLARTYPCTYCSSCKLYTWSAHYTLAECEDELHDLDPSIRSVSDMKLGEVDRAGVVHSVKIKTGRTWRTLSRKMLYGALKDIKSYSFTLHKEGNSIRFDGRGYGHHTGMCQWGARQMVKDGSSYQEVLKFYYPGTKLMKLEIV